MDKLSVYQFAAMNKQVDTGFTLCLTLWKMSLPYVRTYYLKKELTKSLYIHMIITTVIPVLTMMKIFVVIIRTVIMKMVMFS